jgi:hypothetical protein
MQLPLWLQNNLRTLPGYWRPATSTEAIEIYIALFGAFACFWAAWEACHGIISIVKLG